MKERITFLLHVGEEGFDPAKLSVGKDSLTVPPIKAAKEHRITLGLPELTQEILSVLKQCHELHIRWAAPNAYTSTPPFVSRTSPGLHVYFTPRREQKVDALCPLLQEAFGDDLKCTTPSETFITPPILAERFSMSASSQYHSLLPSLENLVTYIQQKLCSSDASCETKAASLLSADYVDIDFDAISHALVLNAFWSQGPEEGGHWNEKISRDQAGSMEVGILNNEVPIESEELSLSGFLTVLGEDAKPKATLFSFPSRHHPLPSVHHPAHPSYTVSFSQPTGLHPTLHLSFPRASTQLTAPLETCALHTYLTLPSGFFLDKYQFSDQLFLESHNLAALHALAGATDLEAPDWVVPAWGSIALFELRDPASASPSTKAKPKDSEQDVFEVTIPLHLRYQPPNRNASGLADAQLPWPVVFWACPADEGTKFPTNPFDRTNLGYEGLFGPRVMFYHVPPAAAASGVARAASAAMKQQQLVETVKVPVLDLDKAAHVEWGTVLAVLAASAWLMWKLASVVRASGFGRVPADASAATTGAEATRTDVKKGR
ncbi:PIG-X [Phyllosticta citriasiana]|uniref:Protein PBN1 n=1 Tax=Phyllosticta citriasiana TaxID=595635 RepID=A0ABR1L171_9PEZI